MAEAYCSVNSHMRMWDIVQWRLGTEYLAPNLPDVTFIQEGKEFQKDSVF